MYPVYLGQGTAHDCVKKAGRDARAGRQRHRSYGVHTDGVTTGARKQIPSPPLGAEEVCISCRCIPKCDSPGTAMAPAFQTASSGKRRCQERQALIHAVVDAGVVVGKLLIAMHDVE